MLKKVVFSAVSSNEDLFDIKLGFLFGVFFALMNIWRVKISNKTMPDSEKQTWLSQLAYFLQFFVANETKHNYFTLPNLGSNISLSLAGSSIKLSVVTNTCRYQDETKSLQLLPSECFA
jgi:hypothetical protein